ncbi:hypothetical protein INR49_011140 [Caranx melampygus]|nr:hypothetical protein INR49_011140 [Caranx melampygus]
MLHCIRSECELKQALMCYGTLFLSYAVEHYLLRASSLFDEHRTRIAVNDDVGQLPRTGVSTELWMPAECPLFFHIHVLFSHFSGSSGFPRHRPKVAMKCGSGGDGCKVVVVVVGEKGGIGGVVGIKAPFCSQRPLPRTQSPHGAPKEAPCWWLASPPPRRAVDKCIIWIIPPPRLTNRHQPTFPTQEIRCLQGAPVSSAIRSIVHLFYLPTASVKSDGNIQNRTGIRPSE